MKSPLLHHNWGYGPNMLMLLFLFPMHGYELTSTISSTCRKLTPTSITCIWWDLPDQKTNMQRKNHHLQYENIFKWWMFPLPCWFSEGISHISHPSENLKNRIPIMDFIYRYKLSSQNESNPPFKFGGRHLFFSGKSSSFTHPKNNKF